MNAIKVESITFFYKDKKLLDDLSFTLEKGEIVSIIGRSGSGKTTIFRLLTGLVKPAFGSIQVNGTLSYMTQMPMLLPWRNVLGNLMLLKEFLSDVTEEKALHFLKEVGLSGKEHLYPKELSGGMQSRVCLARALLEEKEILLLDEPFAFLDAITREEMQSLIKNIQQKYKKSILLVTHDIKEAIDLSDRIYLLDQGKIKEQWQTGHEESLQLAGRIKCAL